MAAKPKRPAPWRDNIEALAMAIIMALLLKYFIVEAYKIPTGSMQPTLMGHARTGIFDRILVDKLSFRYRDPERFEVVVFRYPLDRSKNYVKRVVGMPDEQLRIRYGDVWVRADESEEWHVLQRPRPVQHETWKRLVRDNPEQSSWKTVDASDSWALAGGRRIWARGSGRARFRPDQTSINDEYSDGYPDGLAPYIAGRSDEINPVGDLRLDGQVSARPGCEWIAVELREGQRRYVFTIPGPAAADDARPRVQVFDEGEPAALVDEVGAGAPYRLEADRAVRFGAQNLDDLLELEIGGHIVCALEVDPVEVQTSSVFLALEGEGADFEDLMVYRDIYYLAIGGGDTWTIPPGNYFMLGDNTQDSSDSRVWTLSAYEVTDPETGAKRILRGNAQQGENPLAYMGTAGGPTLEFRDLYGELHRFKQADSERLPPENSFFVPRAMILGRALAVFWPFKFTTPRVFRLKWVR